MDFEELEKYIDSVKSPDIIATRIPNIGGGSYYEYDVFDRQIYEGSKEYPDLENRILDGSEAIEEVFRECLYNPKNSSFDIVLHVSMPPCTVLNE